jgi:hypothetical protein
MANKNHDDKGRFAAGDMVKFNGESADGKFSGLFPVKVINPHSNADKVSHTDKSGRMYEGAFRHLPTATVERGERKGNFPVPARQFEAYHHTLFKL